MLPPCSDHISSAITRLVQVAVVVVVALVDAAVGDMEGSPAEDITTTTTTTMHHHHAPPPCTTIMPAASHGSHSQNAVQVAAAVVAAAMGIPVVPWGIATEAVRHRPGMASTAEVLCWWALCLSRGTTWGASPAASRDAADIVAPLAPAARRTTEARSVYKSVLKCSVVTQRRVR